jgi:sarcosine oxidase subunit gamma
LFLVRPTDSFAVDLARALQPHAHALVDVSHHQIAFQLHGPDAADILNAGCPLDLHPDAFPVGMCTRTVLAKSGIILWRVAPETFRLGIVRSFAPYVRAFLEEAARA